VKNRVFLRTQLAENLPSIQGDRVQLQQVMLNLIVNAVEAMSTSGNEPRDLRISTARLRPDALLIAVQDSGPGVDSADLPRVFDTFYSTKPAGLGMGLSICRAIVESHGGTLWVSRGVPRGAIFQFTLPVCADGAGSAVAGCNPSRSGEYCPRPRS
jgi:signal transduction histidine kinase